MVLRLIKLKNFSDDEGDINIEALNNSILSMANEDYILVVNGEEPDCDELVSSIVGKINLNSLTGTSLERLVMIDYPQSKIAPQDIKALEYSCIFAIRCDLFKEIGGINIHKSSIVQMKHDDLFICLGLLIAAKVKYYFDTEEVSHIYVPETFGSRLTKFTDEIIANWEDVDNIFNVDNIDNVVLECIMLLENIKFTTSNSFYNKKVVIVTPECIGHIRFDPRVIYVSESRSNSSHIDYVIDDDVELIYCCASVFVNKSDDSKMSIYTTSTKEPETGVARLFRPDFYVPSNGAPAFLTKAIGVAKYLRSFDIEIHALYDNVDEHVYKLIQILRKYNNNVTTCLYSFPSRLDDNG